MTTPSDGLIERAKTGDLDAQWQLAVESASGIIPTSTAKRLSLRLVKQRARPTIARSFTAIDPKLQHVLRRLAFGEIPWPLYLWGPVGTGKTLAAMCLCDIADDSVFWSVEELADRIMAGESGSIFTDLRKRTIGALDELGTRSKESDLHYDVVKRFTDAREGQGRVAVYVSNLKPSELQSHFDDRIADRLLCGTVFQLGGESRRRAR